MYLDTTFAYRTQNIDIVDRYIGIEMLIRKIMKYPSGTTFRLLNTTFGFEEVWLRLVDAFGLQSFTFGEEIERRFRYIHQPKDHLQLNVNPVDSIDMLLTHYRIKSQNEVHHQTNARYKFFVGKNFNKCMVTISASIDLTKSEFENIYGEKRKGEFDSIDKIDNCINYTAYSCRFNYRVNHSVVQISKDYLSNLETGLFLPLDLKFIFSRHSSCRECLQFVSLFEQHVCELYPIVSDVRTWMRGFTMKRYFSFACLSNKFRYDNEMSIRYGPSPVNDNETVKLVNYWSNSLSENDRQQELAFMGQASGSKRHEPSEIRAKSRLNLLTGYKRLPITNNNENAIRGLDHYVSTKEPKRGTLFDHRDFILTDSQSSKSPEQLNSEINVKEIETSAKEKPQKSLSFDVTYSFTSSTTSSDTSTPNMLCSEWRKFEINSQHVTGNINGNSDSLEYDKDCPRKKKRKLRARNTSKIRDRISRLL